MSNAQARADEIRDLLAAQNGLEPDFVTRVLKLCRMHESLEGTLSEERYRLVKAREDAEKFAKKERAEYDRLITRVHNQRQEINRLQRRVDELETSQGLAAGSFTQPPSGGGSEPGDGVQGDDALRASPTQSTQAERYAAIKGRVPTLGVSKGEEEL